MSDVKTEAVGQRDRSPSFPFIPLETAVERLVAFEEHHKRSPVLPDRVGPAWGMRPNSSQAQQTLAALKAFGFLETRRGTDGRSITVSEDGRTYLRAQQDAIKEAVLRDAALKPKQIEIYWKEWGVDRPSDPACLDALVLRGGFSQDGAEKFLRVYDATIAYAKLGQSDKMAPDEEEQPLEPGSLECGVDSSPPRVRAARPDYSAAPQKGKVALMEGERELTTGLLSKDASFRLIVSGKVGEKEIERLIRKLELDKEILAEATDEKETDDGAPEQHP